MTDLRDDIKDILLNYMTKHGYRIVSEWHKDFMTEGNAQLKIESIQTKRGVRGLYVAWGQKAWIMEHGKGSKMDDESANPDLASYKHSKYWNTEREGTEIRSRHRSVNGQGWGYLDLDNNKHRGSGMGMPHGINVEEQGGRFHGAVEPLPARHVIKEEITKDNAIDKAMLDEIDSVMTGAVDDIIEAVNEK